ncbi:MAG TPA: HAD family phosphatase [Verrucomicrobiales bacterium]|nr:HAD family phosphatase [Verrucomicrobiales bacterium]
MRILGAIFDWDGVIIDSEAQHRRSWDRLAEETGLPFPRGAFERSFGMRNAQIIPDILGWAAPGDHGEIARLADRKEALYREEIRSQGIEALPGIREFLETLRQAGIPCAVGSSTSRKNIDTVLELTQLSGCFDAIVSAEDVSKGKPDPDVFLRAAERLRVEPAHCVVFEDAHVGIEAARRGGMRVVGLATTHPAKSLSAADVVTKSLEGWTLESLGQALGVQ